LIKQWIAIIPQFEKYLDFKTEKYETFVSNKEGLKAHLPGPGGGYVYL
jgi:hypothetical protein